MRVFCGWSAWLCGIGWPMGNVGGLAEMRTMADTVVEG